MTSLSSLFSPLSETNPIPSKTTTPTTTTSLNLTSTQTQDEEETSYSDSSDEFLTLEEFMMELPRTIHRQSQYAKQNQEQQYPRKDLIAELFSRLILDKDEWDRFSFFDPTKNYTRNLICTDNRTFTLLLLCWNPNRSSPIHDHPCDGCWMRVCEGTIYESRYLPQNDNDELKCVSHSTFREGEQAYIEDSMGYHKVGNSTEKPAVTMHLYSPPFEKCKIWLDEKKASRSSVSCVCYHSEYGVKV